MKALAIKQPWAWLIVHGHKSVENRTWKTSQRGKILVHASQKPAADYPEIIQMCRDEHGIDMPEFYDVGGIVGRTTITDCVTGLTHPAILDNPWFCGCYGFVLENARPLPFIQFKGALGFFETGLTLESIELLERLQLDYPDVWMDRAGGIWLDFEGTQPFVA